MRTFPADSYQASDCLLVPVPAALVPMLAGCWRQLEQRGAWLTDADYEQAYNAIAAVQACMTAICAKDLIESNRQLYRLLDSAFFGRQYSAAGTGDDITITPDIPPAPAGAPALPGLLARSERLEQLLDNALNGTFYDAYPSNQSIRVDLRAILEQLQAGQQDNLDPEILAQLVQIAALI